MKSEIACFIIYSVMSFYIQSLPVSNHGENSPNSDNGIQYGKIIYSQITYITSFLSSFNSFKCLQNTITNSIINYKKFSYFHQLIRF